MRGKQAMAAAGRVTVLLWVVVVLASAVCAEGINSDDPHVFKFIAQFHTPAGPGRLEGLMASDGARHRVALYWAEPSVLRESGLYLRCADFILTPGLAYYWIHGSPRSMALPLPCDANEPLLPKVSSAEAVARSALAIVGRNTRDSLAMGDFFRGSRNRAEYKHEAAADASDCNYPEMIATSDAQVMNALPYGRTYAKAASADGTVTWHLRRALDDFPLVVVTIRPVEGVGENTGQSLFNPNTLGQWMLVPDPYRAYWSFDRASTERSTLIDKRVAGRESYDRIGSYLHDSRAPAEVRQALDRLRFKAALETGDQSCVWQAARESATYLLQDHSARKYEGLLELGNMSAKITRQYPQYIEEELRPLVRQMVRHVGSDMGPNLDRIITAMERNNWRLYGRLVLEETRNQGLVKGEVLDSFATRFEAFRVAGDWEAADPCESILSVRRYISLLDAPPPKGPIDMNDVRRILQRGLTRQFQTEGSEAQHTIVENVLESIRLIAGEGPFVGDAEKLTESIERYAELYLAVDKAKEPIDTVLATFLALSFCDISTSEDHDLLCSQFCAVCTALQTCLNERLTTWGLDSLVSCEDLNDVFAPYKRVFRNYVDDPLWPAFKFPLTANEQTRLASRLESRFAALEPVFGEMSLKLKYGGVSAALKDTLARHIHRISQELLPEAAFLRRPSYPGVSCRYRCQFGFTVVIGRPLYREDDRPRDKFKAMRYFHLGHRLRGIVEQERNIATSARKQELNR